MEFPRDVFFCPRGIARYTMIYRGIPRVLAGSHGGKKKSRGTLLVPWDFPRFPVGCTTGPHRTRWYTVVSHEDFPWEPGKGAILQLDCYNCGRLRWGPNLGWCIYAHDLFWVFFRRQKCEMTRFDDRRSVHRGNAGPSARYMNEGTCRGGKGKTLPVQKAIESKTCYELSSATAAHIENTTAQQYTDCYRATQRVLPLL